MYNDIHIGIGTSSTSSESWTPYNTYYYSNKAQFLILGEELEGLGIIQGSRINALSLKVFQQPGKEIRNLRIRIKETKDRSLSSWHTSDLLLVHHSPTISGSSLATDTIYKYQFDTEYKYKGYNLLIEISRNDNSYTSGGGNYIRTGLSNGRMLTAYKDSGYSYPFDNIPINSTLNSILDISLSVKTPNFKMEGTYTSNPLRINGSYRLRWLEDRPIGTNIKVYKIPEEIEVFNGEIIDVGDETRFKIILSTTDAKKTPALKSLWLEEPYERQDTILITMKTLKRFNNVESDLTVNYDSSKGSLTGLGGAVESFNINFTPEELIPKLNPYVTEKIEVIPNILLDFIKVKYNHRYKDDKITAKPNIAVNFIKVGEINP